MKHSLTLDIAKEQFQATPNQRTAITYRQTAIEYYDDGMIDDDTLLAALKETISYHIKP